MGAWGVGALETDCALDFLGSVADGVEDKIQKALVRFHEAPGSYGPGEEIRAAGHLIATAPTVVGYGEIEGQDVLHRIVAALVEALTLLMQTEEWLDRWDTPSLVVAEIATEIAALGRVVLAEETNA